MRDIQLDFTSGNGVRFDFSNPIDGFASTVQNILVEIGQKAGTDIIYQDKGNTLQKDSASGGLVDPASFSSAITTIATNVQNFVNDNEDPDNEETLYNLDLELQVWEKDAVRLNVVAKSTSGNVLGAHSTIN